MIRLCTLLLLAFTFTQCNFFDSTDKVPMLLELDQATITTNFDQGAATHNIKDVWVFVDGFSVGVFELPATVPILSDQSTALVEIIAGVRSNGQNANAIRYPFFETKSMEIEFIPESRVPVNLNFNYRDDVVFKVLEGFEGGHIFEVDVDGNTNTSIEIDTEEFRSGLASGLIKLDTANIELEVTTTNYLDVAEIQNNNLYLEMDYKNDTPFQVGLLTVIGNLEFKEYAIVLKETEGEWNKIYIELASGLNGGVEKFKLLIGANNLSEECQRINIDNIKLLHF